MYVACLAGSIYSLSNYSTSLSLHVPHIVVLEWAVAVPVAGTDLLLTPVARLARHDGGCPVPQATLHEVEIPVIPADRCAVIVEGPGAIVVAWPPGPHEH